MALNKTLMPRSYMIAETYSKLTAIQEDFRLGFAADVDRVAGAYDIEGLDEQSLTDMMASFSLLALYNSLPNYYHGDRVNSAGTPYPSPLDKVKFMQSFLKEMLRLRKDVGTFELFDLVMGILGVKADEFVVIQDFMFHDKSVGPPDTVQPRAVYVSKYSGTADYDALSGKLTWKTGDLYWGFKPGESIKYDGVKYTISSVPGLKELYLAAGPVSSVWGAKFIKYKLDPEIYYLMPPSYTDLFPSETPGFVGDRLDPTNTLTVDILSVVDAVLAPEFIEAVRKVVNFLKPVHVVFKDIQFAVYMSTDMFYDMTMSQRGQYAEPSDADGVHNPAPDYRFSYGALCSAVHATNRIETVAPYDFVAAGFRPGMLLTSDGFTSPLNVVRNARIVDVAPTFIELNPDDEWLVNEGSLPVLLRGDFDHSFQDGLIPVALAVQWVGVFSVDATGNYIERNDANPGVIGFDIDGFHKGMQLLVSGFVEDKNNLTERKEVLITNVTNDKLYLSSFADLTTEAAAAQDVRLEMIEPYGMAKQDGALPKPFIEESSNTMHPVGHQPGPVPTLATLGSYMARSASQRTARLDQAHFNNLGTVVGGKVDFDGSPLITTSTSTSSSTSSTSSSTSSLSSSSSSSSSTSSSSSSSSSSTTAYAGEDRYWRGAGNWSDPSKWAKTAGGPTGYAPPVALDTVYFDAVSSNCAIDVNANCLAIDTTGYTGLITFGVGIGLVVEGNGKLVGAGSILSNNITLNNSIAGTSEISIATWANGGLLYLRKTTTFVTANSDAYNLGKVKVADPGTSLSCATSFKMGSEFTVNGGSFTFTGSQIKTNNAVSTIIDFVAGSVVDIGGSELGGHAKRIRVDVGVDLRGDWSNANVKMHMWSGTNYLNTDVQIAQLVGAGATLVTNGYDLVAGVYNDGVGNIAIGAITINSSTGVGGNSAITITGNVQLAGAITQGSAAWNFSTPGATVEFVSGWTGGSGTVDFAGALEFPAGSGAYTFGSGKVTVQGRIYTHFSGAGFTGTITKGAGDIEVYDYMQIMKGTFDGGSGGGKIIIRNYFYSDPASVINQGNVEWQIGGNNNYGRAFEAQGGSWNKNAAGFVKFLAPGNTVLQGDIRCNDAGAGLQNIGNAEFATGCNVKMPLGIICDNFTLSGGALAASAVPITINGDAVLSSGTFSPGACTIEVVGNMDNSGNCISNGTETWAFNTTGSIIDFNFDRIYNLAVGPDIAVTMRGGPNSSNYMQVANDFAVAEGTTVSFTSGDYFQFYKVSWLGVTANDIVLQGTSAAAWYMKLVAAMTSSTITFVQVEYSDASAGVAVEACDGTCTDNGNNTNWVFIRSVTFTPSLVLLAGSDVDLFSPVDGESGTLVVTGSYFYPYWGFVAIDANTLSGPVHVLGLNSSIPIVSTTYNYSRSGGTVTVTPVTSDPVGLTVYPAGVSIKIKLTHSYSPTIDNPQGTTGGGYGPTFDIPPYTGAYPTAALVTSHTIDHANPSVAVLST